MKSLPFALALLFCGILIASIAEKGHTEHLDPSVENGSSSHGTSLNVNTRGPSLPIIRTWAVQK